MAAPLPKLSYVLLAHNRELYIRAAIESAFAQQYEGELEYIFSDDCSTDGTYAIMQECVAAYKGGRRVVLTQTPQNGHLAAHTNHAVSFVESDWVVRADDDDYSAVDRCALIGRAIAENPDCRYVATGLRHFTDEQDAEAREASLRPCGAGAILRREDIREPGHRVCFCSSTHSFKAWHISTYRHFGPLAHDACYVDDITCYYRANLLGCGVYVDHAPAVLVRRGCGNMSRGGSNSSRGYASIVKLEKFYDKYHNLAYPIVSRELETYRQYVQQNFPEADGARSFIASVEADLNIHALMRTFWRGGIINRFRISRSLGNHGLFTLARCLPLPLFAAIQATVRKIKSLF